MCVGSGGERLLPEWYAEKGIGDQFPCICLTLHDIVWFNLHVTQFIRTVLITRVDSPLVVRVYAPGTGNCYVSLSHYHLYGSMR